TTWSGIEKLRPPTGRRSASTRPTLPRTLGSATFCATWSGIERPRPPAGRRSASTRPTLPRTLGSATFCATWSGIRRPKPPTGRRSASTPPTLTRAPASATSYVNWSGTRSLGDDLDRALVVASLAVMQVRCLLARRSGSQDRLPAHSDLRQLPYPRDLGMYP